MPSHGLQVSLCKASYPFGIRKRIEICILVHRCEGDSSICEYFWSIHVHLGPLWSLWLKLPPYLHIRPMPFWPMATAQAALISLFHSLLLLEPDWVPEKCSSSKLQSLQEVIQSLVDAIGTPPYIQASISIWVAVCTALSLHTWNLPCTPENLEPYSNLRPICNKRPEHFASLAILRHQDHPEELWTKLCTAVDTVRDLQCIIDINPSSDQFQQLGSLALYYCELELMNCIHILDTRALPVAPGFPVMASQSQAAPVAFDESTGWSMDGCFWSFGITWHHLASFGSNDIDRAMHNVTKMRWVWNQFCSDVHVVSVLFT